MENNLYKKFSLDYKISEIVESYEKEYNALSENFLFVKEKKEFGDFSIQLNEYLSNKAFFARLVWPYPYWNFKFYNKKKLEDSLHYLWGDFVEANLRIKNLFEFFKDKKDVNNAVLYKIIKDGGAREGSRRGALYAEKFNLDINIPVQYSVDLEDCLLKNFLTFYSDKIDFEMECPVNYFKNNSKTLEGLEVKKLKNIFEELA